MRATHLGQPSECRLLCGPRCALITLARLVPSTSTVGRSASHATTKSSALLAGTTWRRSHLELIEPLVPPEQRSRLLPIWRVAGWLTGALPALFGRAAVFRTIEAVETFGDGHDQEQTSKLTNDPRFTELHALVERCRLDEIADREDAAGRLGEAGLPGRIWSALVGYV